MTQTIGPEIAYRVPDWLASDTEESVVGTEWHQEAIGALADMLRDVADRRGAAWGVCEQVALIGLQHVNGTDYDPRPDVMVLPRPLPRGSMASVRLAAIGAPLLIAEMASDSTKGNDQGEKRLAYAAIGVAEYLVFDPGGEILSAPLHAWRLQGDAYAPWEPDSDGWWRSAALDVAFRIAQPLLNVRDRDGTVIEPSGLVRRRARELEQRLRVQAEERGALEQRLADLERQLRELRAEEG